MNGLFVDSNMYKIYIRVKCQSYARSMENSFLKKISVDDNEIKSKASIHE